MLHLLQSQSKDIEKKKHSEFVEVIHNGKKVFIRKSTAIWLFQDCELVSSDRLFRVRAVQPNSSQSQINIPDNELAEDESLPTQLSVVKVGDVCVSRDTRCDSWKIGKVLQFYYPTGKTAKARQCTLTCITLSEGKNVGVVCAWFEWHIPLSLKTFMLSDNPLPHSCMIEQYAFTLSEGCFEMEHGSNPDAWKSSIIPHNNRNVELMCAKLLTLSDKAISFLREAFEHKTDDDDECYVLNNVVGSSACSSATPSKPIAVWRKYGCYTLTVLHKSRLCSGQLLDDCHMGAAQALLRKQCPHVGGLCNTVMQHSDSVQPFKGKNNLQIIHVKLGLVDHWILLSTIGCSEGEVEVYNSLQLSPNLDTQTVIARYLKSQLHAVRIRVANVALQKGSSDCGLYVIAMMTSLAYNEDPTTRLYSQQELRVHLQQCFERGTLEPFPASRTRRVKDRIAKEITCLIYCKCRLPETEDGSKMVQCERCQEWYHLKCLNSKLSMSQLESTDEWYCADCEIAMQL